LIDVIIEEKASLFVCAIGVPPKEVVDKLHKAGIPIMNVRQFCSYAKGTDPNALDRWSDIPTMYPKPLLPGLISSAHKREKEVDILAKRLHPFSYPYVSIFARGTNRR
jgi:hypothetical protein